MRGRVADCIYASPSILNQTCLKTRASITIPPDKQYLTQNGYSSLRSSVSMSIVDEKPLADYILRHDNFGLIYINFGEKYSDRKKQQEPCCRRKNARSRVNFDI